MTEWQPIETKPKDHFPVLIDGLYGIHVAFEDIDIDPTAGLMRPGPTLHERIVISGTCTARNNIAIVNMCQKNQHVGGLDP